MMSTPVFKLFYRFHLQRCVWSVWALRSVCSGNRVPLTEATSACHIHTTNGAGRVSNCRAPRVLQSCSLRVQQHRRVHVTSVSRGLEEFFPKTDDIIEEGEKNGTCLVVQSMGGS